MNAPTLPGSSPSNQAGRPPATSAADGPALVGLDHPVIIHSDGTIEPRVAQANPGDTYTVENKFGAAAVVWDNASASRIVDAGTTSPPIPCDAGDVYTVTIMTNDAIPQFVNSKINVGSGPKDLA